MSADEEFQPDAGRPRVPVDPVQGESPNGVAPLAPRVRWVHAAALQLGAGGIAGFVVPIILFKMDPNLVFADATNVVVVTVVLLISAAVVGVFGGGIPLFVAWISWLIVSRRRRRLTNELCAVILGAFGGALIPSAVPFVVMSVIGASSWEQFGIAVLILGGPSAIAFALWVAAAWRRVRKAAPSPLN